MSGKVARGKRRRRKNAEDDCGCAFVTGAAVPGPGSVNFCNAPREPGSPYCPEHRALCHLPKGSAAEGRQLREIEALAEAVGGRQGRVTRYPPDHLLRRLDRIARASLRAKCSRIVQEVQIDGDAANR